MLIEALFSAVYDAAQVQLSRRMLMLLTREKAGLATDRLVYEIVNLGLGLEVISQLGPGPDRDAVIGYLIETYGLLSTGTDPLLRPLLPPIPSTGATVSRFVLSINSRALRANNALIAIGGKLIPNQSLI